MIDTPKPAKLSDRARIAQAYARVLGTDDRNRNSDQRVVFEDMERRGYIRRPTLVADTQGHLCPLRLAQAEGMRMFHLDTKLLIHEGHNQDPEAKPKQRGKSVGAIPKQ